MEDESKMWVEEYSHGTIFCSRGDGAHQKVLSPQEVEKLFAEKEVGWLGQSEWTLDSDPPWLRAGCNEDGVFERFPGHGHLTDPENVCYSLGRDYIELRRKDRLEQAKRQCYRYQRMIEKIYDRGSTADLSDLPMGCS